MAVEVNGDPDTTLLETFAPATGAVAPLGQIACAGVDGLPVNALAVDRTSGALQLAPDGTGMQLAGTGSGRLFVVESETTAAGQTIVQVAPTTGTVVETYPPLSTLDFDLAPIAVWNGDIYTFPASTYTVTDAGDFFGISRFRPSDGTNVTVATVEGQVVGASASTCAPSP